MSRKRLGCSMLTAAHPAKPPHRNPSNLLSGGGVNLRGFGTGAGATEVEEDGAEDMLNCVVAAGGVREEAVAKIDTREEQLQISAGTRRLGVMRVLKGFCHFETPRESERRAVDEVVFF